MGIRALQERKRSDEWHDDQRCVLQLFMRYNVHVGISIDGPGELNRLRTAGTSERTQRATARSERAIEQLCAAGIPPGIITTVHAVNARPEKLERMNSWFRHRDLGVRSVRLHVLESENEIIRSDYGLRPEDSRAAFLSVARTEKTLRQLRFDVLREMRAMPLGDDARASCVWRAYARHWPLSSTTRRLTRSRRMFERPSGASYPSDVLTP